jgi:D-xylose 1-dehydrogenase (NADP+, D-xylono-1,5-lactone-forming)
VSERLRVGVLGAGYIADRALVPAMQRSSRARCVAVASRSLERAGALASRHGIGTVAPEYAALLDDPGVDAVYIALHNSAHLEWTLRALSAGKHVLCEKPLAMNAAEVREIMHAADSAGRSVMEAFMYRFHPRMRAARDAVQAPVFAAASFGFTLQDESNYRLAGALGGGALLDVGCYTLDVLRWFMGEPEAVSAVMSPADGVDMSVACVLRFTGGATASAWASFAAPEQQELLLLERDSSTRIERPFTSWRDPHDPYQLMVDAFAVHVLDGTPSPRPLTESLGTAELMDRVRSAANGQPAPRARAAARRRTTSS